MYIVSLDMHEAQDLIVDLNLNTPDAVHLAWASTGKPYDYFVTDDRNFFEIRDRVRKPKIVRPSGLHTYKELKAEKHTRKIEEQPVRVNDDWKTKVIRASNSPNKL